jgi:hypothetical protein
MTPLAGKTIIVDWLNKCFFHDFEQHLKSKNLETKLPLNLQNAPGHPQDIGLICPNI